MTLHKTEQKKNRAVKYTHEHINKKKSKKLESIPATHGKDHLLYKRGECALKIQ